ncbi:hypothetical protein RJ640_024485 [Escallonia rubra]|uniref:Uncharacterized protein n=1 Tax=Escallonia rubra TaxID=112253 RepID=A0AA88UWN9_9ASTE|nr:hypothetical protein RJ640_024485 [Escallonia rubra]
MNCKTIYKHIHILHDNYFYLANGCTIQEGEEGGIYTLNTKVCIWKDSPKKTEELPAFQNLRPHFFGRETEARGAHSGTFTSSKFTVYSDGETSVWKTCSKSNSIGTHRYPTGITRRSKSGGAKNATEEKKEKNQIHQEEEKRREESLKHLLYSFTKPPPHTLHPLPSLTELDVVANSSEAKHRRGI